jgi:hypothetical protein
MFIPLKINVRPNVSMKTFSLCFCTSLFVKNKYRIIKSLGGYQLQIEFINSISFVFFVAIWNLFKVCIKTISNYFITLFNSQHWTYVCQKFGVNEHYLWYFERSNSLS